MILLLIQHTYLSIPMWKLAIYHREGRFQNGIFFLIYLKQCFKFEVTLRWICCHPHIPISFGIIHLGESTTSGSLGVKDFNPLWTYKVRYISPYCMSPPSSVQVSDKVCDRSIQISDTYCTLLDGGSLPLHISQHVGRYSWFVSYSKRSHQGCLNRLDAPRSAITVFNPLLCRYICFTDKGSFPESVGQWQVVSSI